jgi:hypothetical protein
VEGWIKLHRKFLTWEWFDKSEMVHLFLYLLLKANHENNIWQGVEIKRGQLITGRKILSKDTGISEQSIRTCMNRLKLTNELTIKTTNKYTIITICNYDSYQTVNNNNNQQINQQSTNNQPTINQQSTTNKNEKNEKNEKKIYIPDFSEFKKYVLENNPDIDIISLENKYKSWIVNDWKDGNNKKIQNWKSKILNTMPYLKQNANKRKIMP